MLGIAKHLHIECSRKQLARELHSTINCSIPGLEIILGNETSLVECANITAALETYTKYIELSYNFIKRVQVEECQVPCLTKSYNMQLKHHHNTTWIDKKAFNGKDEFYLAIAYSSLNIESRIESLVFDVGSLLAAAGGNLGLALGFSCLTCIWAVIEILEQYILC